MPIISPKLPRIKHRYSLNIKLTPLDKLKIVLKYTFKLYSIVHIAPYAIFAKKRNEIIKSPLSTLKHLLNKIFRSMGFMSTFIMAFRIFICAISKLGIKFNFLCIGVLSIFVTLGALLEDVQRIEDYTINTIPRVLEGLWDYLRHHGYVKDMKFSMQFMFAVSIGIMLVLNKFFTKELPVSYRNQINFVFGREGDDEEETK